MDAEPIKPLPSRPRALRQRSQSAINKPAASTDPSAADSDGSKRSSLKHRQAHSHHHIQHNPKRFTKDILGLHNGHSFAELSKQSSRISESPVLATTSSTNESGKASVAGHNLDSAVQSQLDGSGVVQLSDGEVERMVLREQWRNKARQSELRSVLHALSEESMKTTRQLDDLYYNLLDRVSGLQATIHSLQELSGLTARLHGQFRSETSELASDLQNQIDNFGEFKAQKRNIEALDVRVRESKQKADGLSGRLEAARKRVSALEEKEKEWQDSVSWRLRWMWIILGLVTGVILAVCVLQWLGYGPEHTESQVPQRDQVRISLKSLTSVPTSVKSFLEEVIGTSLSTTTMYGSTVGSVSGSRLGSRTYTSPEQTSLPGQDPFQRIFDEL